MPSQVQEFVNRTNREYERVHKEFEDQFWGTKMNLKEGSGQFTADKLSATKQAMESFLENPENLATTRQFLKELAPEDNDELKKTLLIFQRTFESYQMSPDAKPLREEVTQKESDLEMKRNTLKTGYTCPETNEFVPASSVALRQMIRNQEVEGKRKAAYEGIRTIGEFICGNGWLEIVKLRNQMAHKLGYDDFYDYKVTQAEGFNKKTLFGILDDLERKTRPIMEKAIATLKAEKGEDAFLPWNMTYKLAGDITKKQDPYFPFEKAVLRYAQCYANMKIEYKGATLNLDLLDREKKYSNGFCHWPQVAWQDPEKKEWIPSMANFTSLAIPNSVGSGKVALATLMHEAGHAAHFANITQPSPLFAQERAPMSVAYAENQSMFLDSLVDDADWRAKYALNRDGEPIPFELIEEQIKETYPYDIFALRNMLVVPYFEKALYELSEEQMGDKVFILKLADEIETNICGGLMGRPVLSVPHIMSDEASCYYHGYVLAEMAVHQTMHYFLEKYGFLTDNPAIGPELTKSYWQCGNSELFLDIVQKLTGKPLTSDAWVEDLNESVADRLKKEKKLYEDMRDISTKGADGMSKLERNEDIDKVLNMRLICSDGDVKLSDSDETKSIVNAAGQFEEYVLKRYFSKL